MNRRDLIKYTAMATGAAVCTPLLSTLLSGCSTDGVEKQLGYVPKFFSQSDFDLVTELVDVILPKTDSPAATEVGVHRMIDHMISVTYKPDDQAWFKKRFEALSAYIMTKKFDSLNDSDKITLLNSLSENTDKSQEDIKSIFLELKQKTVAYYLSTEEIATNYLNYLPVPGQFKPCISVEEVGNKAWAI